ncbi:neprilysin-1-like [Chelonus insularis]|uniref:neprilysin-1-like n=1 Tax=Chelonus insularis TaxID=460826 RepID=UPI00158DB933|nr:neprilysin-1-like [Chelonus insularis]XP_034934336.1 neprilysin-1-like [Chelonus insularis]
MITPFDTDDPAFKTPGPNEARLVASPDTQSIELTYMPGGSTQTKTIIIPSSSKRFSAASSASSVPSHASRVLQAPRPSPALPESPVPQRKKWWERDGSCALIICGLVGLFLGCIIVTGHYYWRQYTELKDICSSKECVVTAASLISAMDTTVKPCNDFFQYACGNWNRLNIIPEDQSSINTFEVLTNQLQVTLKQILEEPLNDADNNATIKAKVFYRSCMDIAQIKKIGDIPLREALKKFGGWPVVEGRTWRRPNESIEVLLGHMRGEFNEGALLDQWIGPDDKNSSINILQIDQMQLALPSRDYYLHPNNAVERAAYKQYMTEVAILLGADPRTAADELQKVISFEIKLANATVPGADRRDTSANYRKMTLRELQRKVPQIQWRTYFQTFVNASITDDELVVSYAMPYFIQMGRIIQETDERVLYNYFLWRLVMVVLPHMIDDYQQKRIEFQKTLLGVLSERSRYSQCVEWTNKKMGTAVGALFVRDHFDSKSMSTALEMIHNIREAFNELLDENHWMDDETRAVAKIKANSINERIGFPEYIKNPYLLSKEYEMLNISRDRFLENVFTVLRFHAARNLARFGQPVDKNSWSTEPAVVNAFYNPNKNDIVLPAGILQPLFYSQHFPKSLNYGGIGVVIGHEITHGFDDKGRQHDKDGNLMQWWNNSTVEAFRARAKCIVDQYSRYKLREINLTVDGELTQGENIADNGGLKQAFRAYKKWADTHDPEPILPGLNMTHDQLFFLNYAQIWCGTMTPEHALIEVRSSEHPPGSVRVMGTLSNSIDFAKAYNCPVGSPMNPYDKCSVW